MTRLLAPRAVSCGRVGVWKSVCVFRFACACLLVRVMPHIWGACDHTYVGLGRGLVGHICSPAHL